MLRMPRICAESRSDWIARRLRSRQVTCMTGSCPISKSSRQMDMDPALKMAAVLSVTFTPWTLPSKALALSMMGMMSVPFGGLYSTVVTNSPDSSTSRNLRTLTCVGGLSSRPSRTHSRGGPLGRFEGVLQEHRDRHRPNPARDRRNPSCLPADRLEIHVADELPVLRP